MPVGWALSEGMAREAADGFEPLTCGAATKDIPFLRAAA